MATIHLLHGLPGTGKTTFAGRLAREHHAIILSHDQAMVAQHGGNPPQADFARFAAEISETLWARAEQLVRQGQDVILDWGFWTRASRDEARIRIAAFGGKYRLYLMVCPAAVARERVLARDQFDRTDVLLINGAAWDAFALRFEPLATDEDWVDVSTAR